MRDWIVLLILACALTACDAARSPVVPTPPGPPAPTPTPTPTLIPSPTPPPAATPTPTPQPGQAERAALAEAAAAVGWGDPAFGEESATPPQRAYHSWSVFVLVLAGADHIMEIRQYPDAESAARGLAREPGVSTTIHRLPARRHQVTSVQYGLNANMDTLVWQSGSRLFWVRDVDNAGGLADAQPLAEALHVAAARHGLLAPPAVTVTRDLGAQGMASGFAVTLRVQVHGTELPDRVVVEERFVGASLADSLGAAYRQEPDGTWVLAWVLQGSDVADRDLIYLVAVPCSVAGTFQAQGTVSFDVAGEAVIYSIDGDETRPVAGPTCTPMPSPTATVNGL